MGKALQSQWDFEDLPTQTKEPQVFTVSELTAGVKKLIERELGEIWVNGEISNLRLQGSGHAYFSLKDASAQLNCVLFRGEARALSRDLLCDGRQVLVRGQLTVYEMRGQYQLRVTAVDLQGVGALQIAFERLKQKLKQEGLFAEDRKRPLPKFAGRAGIVTSLTAAALRDVIHVIQTRDPSLELIIAPCRVQGREAAGEIAAAIKLLNEWNIKAIREGHRGLDLILVTRGGGSLEDLWAFNEEIVARAIYESDLPIISAVGHEIDFTIADFVADVRCATPSVAAELMTQAVFASREWIAQAPLRLRRLVQDGLDAHRRTVFELLRRAERNHPRRAIEERWQHLDDLRVDLARFGKYGLRSCRSNFQSVLQRLRQLKPRVIVERRRELLVRLRSSLIEKVRQRFAASQARLEAEVLRLRLLSPKSVLDRGYSITTDAESGSVIRSAASVRPGQRLNTRVQSGEFGSTVEESA